MVVRLMGTVSDTLHRLGAHGLGAQSLSIAINSRSFFEDVSVPRAGVGHPPRRQGGPAGRGVEAGGAAWVCPPTEWLEQHPRSASSPLGPRLPPGSESSQGLFFPLWKTRGQVLPPTTHVALGLSM